MKCKKQILMDEIYRPHEGRIQIKDDLYTLLVRKIRPKVIIDIQYMLYMDVNNG